MNPEFTFKSVTFPPSVWALEQSSGLECQTSIVVVGANGAGKSRLGAWLELTGPQKHLVHRITAQRSLVFPDSASPTGLQTAMENFHFAARPIQWNDQVYEANKESHRISSKYGTLENVATAQVNDFAKLLTLLVSDNFNTLTLHQEEQGRTKIPTLILETLLQKVIALWQSVLPNRKLSIKGSEVRAAPTGDLSNDYAARAMSDGERVIFYLSGQCLCSPENSIIVVDEPEIHLHKAIQTTFWDAIEKARPDCIFVYLTHDLAFAADRTGATKVCLTDHKEGNFSWYVVQPLEDIPEDIYLEVLGSRKPVLFVEGTHGSHDLFIYSIAYPQFTVKPLGGCTTVVAATKVFRSQREMHRIECFGMVDRDYMNDEQIFALNAAGVFTPNVAEIENLYLIPDLIKVVAEQLLMPDVEKVVSAVKNDVVQQFGRGLALHSMNTMRHQVNLEMGRFSSKDATLEQYTEALVSFISAIDAKLIHDAVMSAATEIFESKKYESILRVFNKKDLALSMGRHFGIQNKAYVEKVKLLGKTKSADLQTLFLKFLPNLEEQLLAKVA